MTLSELAQKRLTFFAFLPLLLAPILSIELSRSIAFLPLISALLFIPLLNNNYRISLSKLKYTYLYVAVFFTLLFAHSYFVADYDEAYERLSKLILIILGGGFFLFILKNTNLKNPQYFTKILLYTSSIAALFLVLELALGESIYRYFHDIKDGASFSTAVYNRGAVVITTLFLASSFLIKNKTKSIIFITTLPVIFMLAMAQSQSAQMLFIAAIGFYFLFPLKKKSFFILSSIAVMSLVLAKPFLSLYLFENFPSFLDEFYVFQQGYAGPRLEIWDYVSRKILESPLWGHGLEFTRVYDSFQNQEKYTTTQTVLHPHSSVLQIWIEFGLMGVVFVIFTFATFTRFIYKNMSGHIQRVSFIMFLSLIFVSSFSHGMWQSWWLGLLFMTTGWVILNNKVEQTLETS